MIFNPLSNEPENKKTSAKIKLFDTEFTKDFGADEIKTFVINGDNIKTDFLE